MKKQKGVKDESDGYQTKVITYIAVCLSLRQDVQNYTIYSEVQDIPLFEDVIVKILFKNDPEPYCFLCQIKHRVKKINFNNEKHKLNEYVNTIKNITHKKDEIILLRDVPVNNIEFWFYSNNYINTNEINKENYSLQVDSKCNSLFHPTHNEICHKVVPKDDKEKQYFDNLHLILNQANTRKMQYQIQELCDNFTTEMADDLIKYIDKYFDKDKIRGLTKNIFETELLRIDLSSKIVKPITALEINENQARLWNDICLNQEITIVEATKDIVMYIFGCFVYKINELYDCKLDWNHYAIRGGKFGKNFNIEKFVNSSKSKGEKHWNTVPDNLETLVIEMWKVGDLPLVLKSTGTISILNKYKHLKKRFIIIGDVKEICRQIQQFSKISLFPNQVFTHVASIHAKELRDKLLKEITVSLQGRKPTSLYSIIDDNHEAMKELTASKILHLIKKRSLFLQKELLDKSERVIYIIVTEEIEIGYDFDFERVDYEINEKIKCRDFEIKHLEEKIKAHSILRHYKQCRIRLNNDKYEPLIHDEVDEFMKNFAVDQDGDDIYGLGYHKLVPVIGERLKRSEANYIQRYLSITSLKRSILKKQGGRIIFLSGNLNSLTQNGKEGTIIQYDERKINEKIQRNETVLIDANELAVEKCWSKHSSKEILYLRLEDEYLDLIKHNNCHNLQRYISPERRKFEECKLLEQNLEKIIINGEPGIGKSSLLKSLAENYHESSYVLFCNLSDCRYELQQRNAQLFKSPLEFIFNKNERSFYKAFLQKIFNQHRENGKMILFLDSFDEILPYYKDQVLLMLDKITSLNIKFVISSRIHAHNILVEKLEMEPIKIENLNPEDVKNYLIEEKLIRINLELISSKFLENPLYLQFLILFYQEDPSMYVEIDQFDLYERFVYKKVERYHKKYKKDYNPNLKFLIDKTLKYHRLMALMLLFDGKILNSYDFFEEYVNSTDVEKEEECKLGFIKHFDEYNFPVFSHQTFAEFLAAQWIIENLFKEQLAKDLHVAIIQNGNYHFRQLYNNILCRGLKLHKAILEDDADLIDQLCSESDVYLREVDKSGRTALHLVSSRNHYKIIDIIIEHMRNKGVSFARKDFVMKHTWIQYKHDIDSNVESYDHLLSNELEFAAENNLINYAEYLLNIEEVRPNLHYLQVAAQYSCVDLLKLLIAHGADNSEKDRKNNTILHYAVRNPQPDVIRYVLDMTTDINQKTSDSCQTPLHVACQYGNVFAVSELLKEGADPNVIDINGENPLYCIMSSYFGASEARMSIMYSLTEHFIDLKQINSKGDTLLHYACRYGIEELGYYLLEKLPEENIYITNCEGHTPFDEACLQENLEMVKHLLNKHPNIMTSVDNEGNTCLHLAARLKSKAVISKLAETMNQKGNANLEIRNNRNETPLHTSVKHSSYDVTEFLLERGHDPNLFDKNGNAPLHFAFKIDSNPLIDSTYVTWTVKILLSKKAKMNSKNIQGYTPLHLAMKMSHNETTINSLLDSFNDYAELIDLTQKDMKGNTLLHYACQYNHQRMVDYIFKKIGTDDIRIKNEDGKTPFHLACRYNHISLVNNLLRDHGEVMELDNNGNTCLHITANMKCETLFFILEKNIGFDEDNRLEIKNNLGETLLHKSVENNSFRITNFLLERGHDPNTFDENGNAPLHLAAKKEHVSLIHLLLRKGADANCRNNDMRTPLHLAAQSRHETESTTEILLNNKAMVNLKDKNGDTPLYLAIKNLFSKPTVDFLIDYLSDLDEPVDVTQTDDQGYTLLHHACKNHHKKAVEYLLKHFKKDAVRLKNEMGQTPFHLACEGRNTEIIECLLRHDPEIMELDRLDDNGNTFWHLVARTDVFFDYVKRIDLAENLEIKNNFGQTPLHMSVMHDFLSVTEFLLERGHDPNLFDKDGNTPLHFAVQVNDSCSIDILVKNGANVNARNNNLETPLHKAIKFRDNFSVEELLRRGADVNSQDIEGNTPLHLEIKTGNRNIDIREEWWDIDPSSCIWKTLLKFGADPNIRNNKGETAMDTAKSLDKKNFLQHIFSRP